jgi:tetratricopeptide (TPR) repeat protein
MLLARTWIGFGLAFTGIASTPLHTGGTGPARATIPGQPVVVSIDVPSFVSRKEEGDLLFGSIGSDTVFSLRVEANMPFVSAAICPERYAKETGFESYAAGSYTACRFQLNLKDVFVQTNDYGYLATHDWLFIVHVSSTRMKDKPAAEGSFTRADVQKMLATLRVTGDAKRELMLLPPELYAFRDRAADHAQDQVAFVAEQCQSSPDAWEPFDYAWRLARGKPDYEGIVKGCARSSELLDKLSLPSQKHMTALVQALDAHAWALSHLGRFADALPVNRKLVEISDPLAKAGRAENAKSFHASALYNSAACRAQTGDAKGAIEDLRRAIAASPDAAADAADDERFKPIAKRQDFLELVKRGKKGK